MNNRNHSFDEAWLMGQMGVMRPGNGRAEFASKTGGGRHVGEWLIEVRDMAIIHRTFHRVHRTAGRSALPTPSPGRVRFLADHIDFAIAALHIHHESEDELLYRSSSSVCPSRRP